MSWAELLPNLLIGLREGLEAGLIVTILVSAVRRADPQRSLVAVWAGVAAAIALSLSFGAVLTFTSASLSSTAQAAFGGVLSVLAVVLVTWMVFWMRRSARSMSGELRDKVGSALVVGGPALVLTAFLAVGREGLETALFVWTNAQAAGSNAAPVAGALAGLVIAFALCLGMYRRLVRVDLARFFTVTGAVLLVIAAGVLAYGVGDLQEAGLLPSSSAAAFDLTATVSGSAWWVEAVRGVTNLDLRMSWLQVIAYLGYLSVTLPLLLVSRGQEAPAAGPAAAPEPADRTTGESRRVWVIGAAAVAVPALVAGVVIAVDGRSASTAAGTAALAIHVTDTSCAAGWAAPAAGPATFAVTNSSGHAVDVELLVADASALVAEIEVLGPGTTRELPLTLATERYQWACSYDGLPSTTSETLAVHGNEQVTTVAVPTVTSTDLAPTVTAYRAYVATTLTRLQREVAALRSNVAAGHVDAAKADWLTAHLTYHRIGAAYDAFGDDGTAVDGLAQGLPGGVADPGFVGFHKIEHDLWGGTSPRRVLPEVVALVAAVDVLETKLPSFTFDPNDISLRTHEILEGTARFSLTGEDDYGSASSLATASADTEGTATLVALLRTLLERQSPGVAARATAELRVLHSALDAARLDGRWPPVGSVAPAQRQSINAAAGQVLETLSVVPALLEIRT